MAVRQKDRPYRKIAPMQSSSIGQNREREREICSKPEGQ